MEGKNGYFSRWEQLLKFLQRVIVLAIIVGFTAGEVYFYVNGKYVCLILTLVVGALIGLLQLVNDSLARQGYASGDSLRTYDEPDGFHPLYRWANRKFFTFRRKSWEKFTHDFWSHVENSQEDD